jgi:sporulation protein YhbH
VRRVDPDVNRFRQIVRGKIKQNLKQYISKGEMFAWKGKNVISIPLPQIELPRFRYGHQQSGGVGQGEGDEGTPIAADPQGAGDQGAGSQSGEHVLEVDISIEELAEILGEELELPHIQPKGEQNIHSTVDRYSGIHRSGPESLRHFKRTFKHALRRQIMAGLYNPERPVIIPVQEDKRFRSWKQKSIPKSTAVIIYMMDVSGSMGNEQKEIVRIESFWIDTWLRSQYREIETRYIVHDATAREVDQHTFFHIREAGGTKISSAYQLCAELIEKNYDPSRWNIYPLHFSDGDNWGGDDTALCMKILKEDLLPASNIFCYGQVKSAYGSGQFIKDLLEAFPGEERLVLSEINNREEIHRSIKTFLGKGR